MRSKLTKTIFTIVFVVFLGLIKVSDVNAGGDMSCYYEKEGVVSVVVTIPDGMGSTKVEVSNHDINDTESLEILNWDSVDFKYGSMAYKDAETSFTPEQGEPVIYNGYDDVWTNERCPRYVIVVKKDAGFISFGKSFVMFSDTSNKDRILRYLETAISSRNDTLYGKVIRADAISLTGFSGYDEEVDDNTDEEDVPISISAHECECDYISSHPRIYTDFVIGENNSLAAPSVHLVYGSDDGNYKVENWSRAIGNTSYTALSDVAKNNTCPAYLIYARVTTWKDHVYLSDEANKSYIRSSVAQKHDISTDDVYTIACNKKVENTRPDLENIEFERPEYDNPSINPNIVKPLTPNSGTVSCGDGYMEDIPTSIVKITSIIYILLQIIVPIALVIIGSMDLVKAVMAQKEDEIKKGQQVFVKRLIVAVIVFFVFAFIKLVVGIVSREDAKIIGCMNCFLNGENSCD